MLIDRPSPNRRDSLAAARPAPAKHNPGSVVRTPAQMAVAPSARCISPRTGPTLVTAGRRLQGGEHDRDDQDGAGGDPPSGGHFDGAVQFERQVVLVAAHRAILPYIL